MPHLKRQRFVRDLQIGDTKRYGPSSPHISCLGSAGSCTYTGYSDSRRRANLVTSLLASLTPSLPISNHAMHLLSTQPGLPLLLLRGQYKNSWNRFRSTALENRDAKAQPPEGTHDWLSQFEVAAKDSNRYSDRNLPNVPRSNRPRCLRIGQHEYNTRTTTIPSKPRCP
jgi:hypothetical protein